MGRANRRANDAPGWPRLEEIGASNPSSRLGYLENPNSLAPLDQRVSVRRLGPPCAVIRQGEKVLKRSVFYSLLLILRQIANDNNVSDRSI